jgi:hypothetical protein
MINLRMILPAIALLFGIFVSAGALAQEGEGGGGADSASIETIDSVTFRRNLARLSTREGRRYAQNLLRRTSEVAPGSIPVVEGFSRFESQDLFAMASADPTGTERLLRQLDRVTDPDERFEILQRAQTDARRNANLTADARTDARNNPGVERRDRQAINRRARMAAAFLNHINRWMHDPEMGTATMPRDRREN